MKRQQLHRSLFKYRSIVATAALLLLTVTATGQFSITLRKSFVDSFKNKVTITAPFEVYYAHSRANPAEKDGDLHIAGYDSLIGLPIVAELMNAGFEPLALSLVARANGDGRPDKKIRLTGAWRLWSEHIKTGAHYYQGSGPEGITNTGPDHVFEIHPVTRIEDQDLGHTLREVEGFKPHEGRKAFPHYLGIDCSISQSTHSITITTRGARYNYSNFWIRLNSTEKYEVKDGLFIYCTVLDESFRPGKAEKPYLLSKKVRMAFVKESAPYFQVETLKKGDYMYVMGIPRISLAEISRRVRRAEDQPSGLHLPLPLEMIIVAILED